MSLHISRLIDKIRAAESRQQRDIILTINEARDLHGEITRLLLALEQLRTVQVDQQTVTVEMQGGSF
jgi:hypothetical protein